MARVFKNVSKIRPPEIPLLRNLSCDMCHMTSYISIWTPGISIVVYIV